MTSSPPSSPFIIQTPRIYKGFPSALSFKETLDRVVKNGGGSPDELSQRKLFPNQDLTVEDYLRKHLPYTIYLLDVATRYAPSPENISGVLTAAARDLLDDSCLRKNYGRLFRVHNILDEDREDEVSGGGGGGGGGGKKDKTVAAALVKPMEHLDRGTWFVDPCGVGTHLSFGGKAVNVPYSPPALGELSGAEFFIDGELHYVPFMRVERTAGASHSPTTGEKTANSGPYDVVKVSTEENPLWGQTYVRLFVDKSEYLVPGGKSFRRLEVLRLLARNNHFNEEGEKKKDSRGVCGRRHFPVPAYTYVDHGNAYLLLHPPVHPLEGGENYPLLGGDGTCTLAQFMACRPRWWTNLGKEEKISSVFGWMTCLASTLSLFHSLKVSHGRIGPHKIVLVHDDKEVKGKGGNTTIFITDWHVPPPVKYKEPTDSMKRIKSSMNTTAAEQEAEPAQAEKSRQQDVKDLGEVFGDLLLVLLGTSREALTRQRKERISWANEVKSRDGFLKNLVENEDDPNRGFYPPLPLPPAAIAVVDNTDSTVATPTPEAGSGSPSAAAVAAGATEAKSDIAERRQSKAILREPAGKLFSSVFSSSKRSSVHADHSHTATAAGSNPVSNAAAELQDRAKLVQQQLGTMLPFTIGKNGPQFAVSWWVEELRLMYPPVNPTVSSPPPHQPAPATGDKKDDAAEESKEEDKDKKEDAAKPPLPQRQRSSTESDRRNTIKTAEFLGNKLLPLLATMVSSEASVRPKSREVWTTLSTICEDYYYIGNDNACCCRCTGKGESEEEVIWDEITETVLRDLYERGVADEEEELWEGMGDKAAAGKFGWRRIGRVGEGVAGECLLD